MSSDISDEALREQLVQSSRLLYERGLIAGFDGNSSVRTERGTVLVTPAGVHKGLMNPRDVVELDLQTGAPVAGGQPTSELSMHLAVLKQRSDVIAVVHSHAPTAVAMSLLPHISINGVLPELVIALGDVQTVPYARPGTEALAQRVARALEHSNAVIIERHGTVAVGRTISEALARTEMIEHAARVLMTAHTVQAPERLDDAELRALRRE
ncbi:MAG: class II aldolase/adducin family protein [Archangiaceae bacterium]|nr:class II aldolase/adducin family protein [Archangiaceae bacterium]